VTVIDVNISNEEDAVKALQHPSTKCICLTNMELASHHLLQLVAHREEPLQEEGIVTSDYNVYYTELLACFAAVKRV